MYIIGKDLIGFYDVNLGKSLHMVYGHKDDKLFNGCHNDGRCEFVAAIFYVLRTRPYLSYRRQRMRRMASSLFAND